jgi:hypothetical protein
MVPAAVARHSKSAQNYVERRNAYSRRGNMDAAVLKYPDACMRRKAARVAWDSPPAAGVGAGAG